MNTPYRPTVDLFTLAYQTASAGSVPIATYTLTIDVPHVLWVGGRLIMVMKYVNWALRRQSVADDTPRCSDHKVEMRLRGVIGQPALYRWQSEEDYTYIYFCPVDKCNQTHEVVRRKSQVPGGTDVPSRPVFARPNDK